MIEPRVRVTAAWDQAEATAHAQLTEMVDRAAAKLAALGEQDPAIVSTTLAAQIDRSSMSRWAMASLLAATAIRLRRTEQ